MCPYQKSSPIGSSPGITLLGLGPGDPGLLTRMAWRVLENNLEVHLRTRQHPVVAEFPTHLQVYSFDHLYESEGTFDAVYSKIVEEVLRLGRRPRGVIYAVPGHPFVAESTAPEIQRRARHEGLPVHIVEGVSFLEPTFTALGLDPFPQMALVDALEIAMLHVPPFSPATPAIIAQIHSREVASDVKLTLMASYPDEHSVYLVHAAGTALEKVEQVPLYEIDRNEHIGLLTSLYVPALPKETSFEAFQEIIAHLRAPDGCPWDREQTHKSLRPYLLEETYEVLAALDAQDPQAMKEEFGDLLLQVILHAQIATEEGEFSMAEVLQHVHHKIVYRHPHVFGSVDLSDSQAVLLNWEKLKAQERDANGEVEKGMLDGVALALPALVQAEQYQKRAARVGFDWQELQGVLDKVDKEMKETLAAEDEAGREMEIGDLLFAVTNLARWYQVDPESALRAANARFKQRFNHIEAQARTQGKLVSDLSREEIEELWQASRS